MLGNDCAYVLHSDCACAGRAQHEHDRTGQPRPFTALLLNRCWCAVPRCWAREPWARASPRTWRTRAFLRLLLDMVPAGEGSRNRLAESALAALAKAKPAAFYESSLAAMITPGNFEDDLPKLKQCDWVIEAVAENLEIKRALLDRVVPHLAPQAVLTTNTSGLPIAKIAAGLKSHRDRFFGTHFFNPPRYMQLLEIIPTAESDAGAGVRLSRRLPIACWASRWSSPTTRRTSSATASASFVMFLGVDADAGAGADALKKWMR